MKAMILAAGVGSRLDPLTRNVPKPLVPIVNRPVMEYLVDLLKKHGVTEIMVNVHYLGDQIMEYFGSGEKWGVNIRYSVERELWGDAGSVKRAEEYFKSDEPEPFIVIGGDDLTDMDLGKLVRTHIEKQALATIALSLVDDPSEYGIVEMTPEGRITRFLEKPSGVVIRSNTANTGVYVFDPEVFELIPRGVFHLFGKQVFPSLLDQNRPLYGHLTAAYWKDVGNLNVYRQTHIEVLEGQLDCGLPLQQAEDGRWEGSNVQIDGTAQIDAPVAIGNNVVIKAGARIMEHTVIGDNCTIEENAVLKKTILWSGAVVRKGTHLERCVVGNNCNVHTDAAIFDGIIVNPQRPGESAAN